MRQLLYKHGNTEIIAIIPRLQILTLTNEMQG